MGADFGLTLGVLFSVYSSILANITPYATDLGATAAQASTLIMAVAIMGLVGKLVFGMAADKMGLKLGLWMAMALVIVAFLIMAGEPAYPVMLLAAGRQGGRAAGRQGGRAAGRQGCWVWRQVACCRCGAR